MEINYKYGYKVSYTELGKKKIKIYLVTNSLTGAIWNIRLYTKNSHRIFKPFLFLEKIKDIKEYNKLWKGCPFKDDLS